MNFFLLFFFLLLLCSFTLKKREEKKTSGQSLFFVLLLLSLGAVSTITILIILLQFCFVCVFPCHRPLPKRKAGGYFFLQDNTELLKIIQAMEMRCYRKILRILLQRPCYQRGSPCQDQAGNRTTRRPPDHRKEMQTEVVWKCLLFIRTGQNHLARHSERGKKTRQTEKEVGGQHQGMNRPGDRQVPEGRGERGKMVETGCEIICGAPTTLAVKGKMR